MINNTPLKLIHLFWEGPKTFEQLNSLNNEEQDYGIYQIYGTHPVYGKDTLLYIGKASERSFKQRLVSDKREWINNKWDDINFRFHIGRLYGIEIPSDDEWGEQIQIAEELLIFSHSPAYNSDHVGSINEDKVYDSIVLNWGNRGMLLPEVTGMTYTDKFWEISQIDFKNLKPFKYKKHG